MCVRQDADEDANEEEEQEAKRLQREAAERLREEDFEIPDIGDGSDGDEMEEGTLGHAADQVREPHSKCGSRFYRHEIKVSVNKTGVRVQNSEHPTFRALNPSSQTRSCSCKAVTPGKCSKSCWTVPEVVQITCLRDTAKTV